MPRKRPDPALEASSSEDEGCFDRPGRGGDDSDEGDALDESAFFCVDEQAQRRRVDRRDTHRHGTREGVDGVED